MKNLSRALAIVAIANPKATFSFAPSKNYASGLSQKQSSFLDAVKLKELPTTKVAPSFDPLHLSAETEQFNYHQRSSLDGGVLATSAVAATLLMFPADADAIKMPEKLVMSSGNFDPRSFNPVCAASDGFYRGLQSTAQSVVGAENFQEYGPLIASGLLRIRLELCVVESFFNEAVGPFIQQNGLSWVLPLHETVETFLAGTVFSLATTFILVGSTKLLTVIITYADFLVGTPMRLFGGFFFDRARGKPVTLDIGFGPFKTRVIGPKDLEISESNDWSVDFEKTGPVEIGVIVLSGGVKAAGQALRVSLKCGLYGGAVCMYVCMYSIMAQFSWLTEICSVFNYAGHSRNLGRCGSFCR